ncbi:hypothetical protein NDU88_007206 [Pleurodeles waltl]|uniref:Uncharacterized protein n=1 Tax=Pleurodeles waltl TaxID=8319 RepID=A0AAV7RNS2_PLEWA|nr:hypothetical protein NDU88_007206 [Pleurodeles waltl]
MLSGLLEWNAFGRKGCTKTPSTDRGWRGTDFNVEEAKGEGHEQAMWTDVYVGYELCRPSGARQLGRKPKKTYINTTDLSKRGSGIDENHYRPYSYYGIPSRKQLSVNVKVSPYMLISRDPFTKKSLHTGGA